MIDFLIVGHGLAGSALAHMLLKRGQRVVVLEDKSLHSASKVAAGLVNPLIGPKLNIPMHMGDCLMQSMNFFRSMEEEAGNPCSENSPSPCVRLRKTKGTMAEKSKTPFSVFTPDGPDKGILRKARY